jgi:anti-sigma factor RsiW
MPGYIDEELDLLNNLQVEQHLQDCPACARDLQNHQALRSALGSSSLYFNAPASLQKRVRSSLREASKAESKPVMLSWRWLVAGGSFALIVILVVGLLLIQSRSGDDDVLAQEVVSSHVRSLMANHLTDVTSTNQHSVKPWFGGKLDFSPQVTDLTGKGFQLVGGRLDYIGNRPVAALVYQRQQHLINLFMWPEAAESGSKNKMSVRQGYNLIHWNKSGMVYWAVSDLNISELQEFVQALQNPT